MTGIIPACAGSTRHIRSRSPRRGDHPRMCGEHPGGPAMSGPVAGSSPHVRGARHRPQRGRPVRGIIPACAGSTRSHTVPKRCTRDHPRMCGEHRLASTPTKVLAGSSPHVRGAQWVSEVAKDKDGIIPACAGSTSRATRQVGRARDHPRMCGEHDRDASRIDYMPGSSPHVRGALFA